MDLARHGTRPPPRPGTRGLSPCLPGRSAREGLGLPPAGTGGQRSRNSTPDARTVDQALQIPCPHVQENGEWAVYALAAIPHADVERLSKFLRARPVHMPARPRAGASRRSDGARARRNQRPALGDGSINRSASRKLDLPPTRRNGSTSSIPGPFRRARNTRILPKVLSVWVHRIEYEQGGWVASLATHAPLCGVRCGERSDNPSFPRILRRVSLRERVLPGTGAAGRLTRPSGGDGQYPV